MKHAIVIGAGIAGLGSAALLSKNGYRVTVLEKNEAIGGRAMVWKQDGFVFDMGPSWYQMPETFERFFAVFGKRPSDYYQLIKLDPQYRIFTDSRNHYDIKARFEDNLELFERLEPGSGKKITAFLQAAKEQYDIAQKHILYKNMRPTDYINPFITKDLARFRLTEKLDTFVSRYVSNPLLKKILLYTALFIGAAPNRIPAMFSLMSYVDHGLGTYYPMGGMGALLEAIALVAKENGVTIHTNAPVSKIEVSQGIATGVIVNGKLIEADSIISAADYPYTETTLLEKEWQTYDTAYWKKKTLSPSAFIIYLGVAKRVENLAHHTLIVPESWDSHFADLFEKKQLPEEPSYYISCPSKTDSSVAPPDCENIFITVQIPSGISIDKTQLKAYRNKLISHIEETIDERFSDDIIVERIFSPDDFKRTFNAYDGAAIGLATTYSQLLLRPQNKSKKVRNLFYAGQYTETGAGLPMSLISAHRVVDAINQV